MLQRLLKGDRQIPARPHRQCLFTSPFHWHEPLDLALVLSSRRPIEGLPKGSNGSKKEMRVRELPLRFATLLIVACLAILSATAAQSADEPVVQAIIFYSPVCPACHYVINEVLVPMVNDYGDRLHIVGVDTSQSARRQLYQAAVERYQIPPERQGVPTLVIGDVVLVGSHEIPEQFPALVEEGLAAGGIGWPDIPGLAQAISGLQQGPSPTPVPQGTATPPPTPTAVPTPSVLTIGGEELPPAEIKVSPPDPVGFALAGVVLAGMVAALSYAAWRVGTARQHLFQLLQLDRNPLTYAKTWAIPLLGLVGLGIAAYLAYVEITLVEAICGPIGECNIVQSSPYARILGIPVAVLGVLHYLAIGVLWVGQGYRVGRLANLSVLGLLGLTLFGTLFSIYLTCLEIFVVRAICTWCLGSAVTTTVLMLLVVVPVTGSPSLKKVKI